MNVRYFFIAEEHPLYIWATSFFLLAYSCFIGEGNGTLLQYSCLENPTDGGAWWAAVHGVVEGRTRLSSFTFTFQFHALKKEMATHSSVLAWRIPGTEEPGGLPSMGSHRVGHDWSDLAAAAAAPALQVDSLPAEPPEEPSKPLNLPLRTKEHLIYILGYISLFFFSLKQC